MASSIATAQKSDTLDSAAVSRHNQYQQKYMQFLSEQYSGWFKSFRLFVRARAARNYMESQDLLAPGPRAASASAPIWSDSPQG